MPGISNTMQLTSFTIEPGAQWNVDCQVAGFPDAWLKPLSAAYHQRPGIKPHWSLPSRSLVELLIGLDPGIVHVSSRLSGNSRFITALPGADPNVIAAAIASWASTEVASLDCDTDWWQTCQASDIQFRTETINLLEYETHPNHTAAGAAQMFTLLPSYLAQHVAAQNMPLLGRSRNWILGPPRSDGRRSAVLWPPEKLEHPKAGTGLATAKITFHVETTPNHPVPHVHADLSISRFPLMPVSYVPARGDGPPQATIWLQAPEGFLRESEPHTLLAATARQAWAKESGSRQWQWKPGLATALGRLTHLAFPNPEKIFTNPAAASEEGKIRSYVLYSEGTKSQAGDIDDLAALALGEDETPKARSFLHIANAGLGPRDHIEAREQIAGVLGPLGVRPIETCHRVGKRNQRKIAPAEPAGQSYTLELWTQSDLTREAILDTLEHHHGLTPAPDPGNPAVIRFTGDLTLEIILKDVGTLGAGIDRPNGNSQPEANLLAAHANHIQQHIG